MKPLLPTFLALSALLLASSAVAKDRYPSRPGKRVKRSGDEIVVCGQLFHTGTKVVTWLDAGGYDERSSARPPRLGATGGAPQRGREGFSCRRSVLG